MSRRSFLVRAAALGIGASALGSVLAACEQAARPSGTSRPTLPSPVSFDPRFHGAPPVIDPTPTTATYGTMLEVSALVASGVPSAGLRALLEEVASESGIRVASAPIDARGQARLAVSTNDPSIGARAYRLEVAPTADGASVTIRARDEEGAYYALLSLARLIVRDGSSWWLRAATVDDAPGFVRRGVILDPWVAAAGGVTEESRTLLMKRVRFAARFKLNFIDLARPAWPELARFCDEHHVEFMNPIGYGDRLTTTPRDELKWLLDGLFDAGARSFSFNWDGSTAANPEAIARQHAEVFADLYAYVRRRDPGVRVYSVLPPYGGIPGRNLFGSNRSGERYLAVMRDALPSDVCVFWTGDGGTFSKTVTQAGAKAYADAIGHEIALWDNDTLGSSGSRQPCSGRASDLSSVVRGYMGNLAGESSWSGTNGEFALLTSLFYSWNPGVYEPAGAAAAAERIIAS